jgi:hypothetical protein
VQWLEAQKQAAGIAADAIYVQVRTHTAACIKVFDVSTAARQACVPAPLLPHNFFPLCRERGCQGLALPFPAPARLSRGPDHRPFPASGSRLHQKAHSPSHPAQSFPPCTSLPHAHPPIPLSTQLLPQVQLDGSVRSSGAGLPPWARLVDDLPELSDVRTKLTDGMGRV